MRILSYNIQAAIGTDSYWRYVSRLHRQVLPARAKHDTLARIADYIAAFDVVCLQEIDLGGLRSGFCCQANILAEASAFAHSLHQTNRVVGKLSRHGNMMLSRFPLRLLVSESLPSRIKGRGWLAAAADTPWGEMVVANAHFSLGRQDQIHQAQHIVDALAKYEKVCLCGDFNFLPDAAAAKVLERAGFIRVAASAPTYPSWQPRKTLDHIFLKGLHGQGQTETFCASDHLPVSAQLSLPAEKSV